MLSAAPKGLHEGEACIVRVNAGASAPASSFTRENCIELIRCRVRLTGESQRCWGVHSPGIVG